MGENLFIIGGIICIVICIGLMVSSIKNYIIIKKAYQETKKSQEKRLDDANGKR